MGVDNLVNGQGIKLDRITSITPNKEPSHGVRNRTFPPKTRRYTRRRMP